MVGSINNTHARNENNVYNKIYYGCQRNIESFRALKTNIARSTLT